MVIEGKAGSESSGGDRQEEVRPGPEARSGRSRPRFFYGWVVVAVSFLCMMISAGLWDCFGIFVKPLLGEFEWSRAVVSSSYSVSFLTYGVVGIATGWLTDRFGPRVVLSICGLFLGAGYLLLSRMDSLWQLFVFEGILLGFGMSGLYAPLLGMVARWFTRLRGVMTGVLLSGLGIGQLLAPLIISRSVDGYGWRSTYIIMGVTVLVVVVLLTQLLRRDPAAMGQQPYGGGSSVRREVAEMPSQTYSLGESVRVWQLWALWLAKLCFGYYFFSFFIHVVPHATDLGISGVNAAYALSFSGAGVVMGSFLLGRAIDVIGPRRVMLTCFVVAFIMMVGLTLARHIVLLYLIAFIVGLANGGLMTADSPMVVRLFGLRSVGSIVGTSSAAFSIGAALGPMGTGYIFDTTGSYVSAFIVAAAFCVVGFAVAVAIRPTPRLGGRL